MTEKVLCSCGADCDYGPQGCSSVVKIAGVNKNTDSWVHCCLAHLDQAEKDCEKNGYVLTDTETSVCWHANDRPLAKESQKPNEPPFQRTNAIAGEQNWRGLK